MLNITASCVFPNTNEEKEDFLKTLVALRRVIAPALLETSYQWTGPTAEALRQADHLLALLKVESDEPVMDKRTVETILGHKFADCPLRSESVGNLY